MLRADALALRDRRKRARSVSAIARNIKSRQHAEMFHVPDHPVRSIKGGFATSFLMSRPPLLYEEGSCAIHPHNHTYFFGYQVFGSRSNKPLASSASAWHWYSRSRLIPFWRASGMLNFQGFVKTAGSSIVTSYWIVSAL